MLAALAVSGGNANAAALVNFVLRVTELSLGTSTSAAAAEDAFQSRSRIMLGASVLEVFLNGMRYINPRFPLILTYLL